MTGRAVLRNRSRVRALAIVLLSASILSQIPVPVSAGNVNPVSTDYAVSQALLNLTNFSDQFVQVVRTVQTLTVASTVSSPYLILKNTWANVTNPTPRSFTLLSAKVWVNATSACGSRACPGVSIQCDSTFYSGFYSPPSYFLQKPCWVIGPIWNNQQIALSGGKAPVYSVTRVDAFLLTVATGWTVSGSNSETYTRTLPPLPSSNFGAILSNFSIPDAGWAVPFPRGVWNPSQTVVRYLNASTTISAFASTTVALVFEWNWFPSGSQNYSTTIYGTPFTNHSGGTTGNTTPTSLSLVAANVTHLQNGYDTATVSWTNNGPSNFTGSVAISGSWVSTASNVTATANGVPIPAYYAGTSVQIPPGTVTVLPGSSVIFVVTYSVTSTLTFTAPVFIFNGAAIGYSVVLALVAVVAVVVLSVLSVSGKVREVASIMVAVLALIGLGGLYIAAA